MTTKGAPGHALVVLDKASELEHGEPEQAWKGVLYPAIGEAVIVPNFRSSASWNRPPETGCSRASRKLRRYAGANRLTRLVTLTFREPMQIERRVLTRIKALLRRLRLWLGSKFPYVRVVESHPGGHGLHVHLLVVPAVARLVQKAWTEGKVDIQRVRGRVGVRRAAAYLAKAFDDDQNGRHRYEVAQGFAPERVTVFADRRATVLAHFCELMGASPSTTAEVMGLAVSLAWWEELPDGHRPCAFQLACRDAA